MGVSLRGGRLAFSCSTLRAHGRRNRVRSTAAIASQQRGEVHLCAGSAAGQEIHLQRGNGW